MQKVLNRTKWKNIVDQTNGMNRLEAELLTLNDETRKTMVLDSELSCCFCPDGYGLNGHAQTNKPIKHKRKNNENTTRLLGYHIGWQNI